MYAVDNRDIPVIQFIVVVLAAFYVCVNIVLGRHRAAGLAAAPDPEVAMAVTAPAGPAGPRAPGGHPGRASSVAVRAVDGGPHTDGVRRASRWQLVVVLVAVIGPALSPHSPNALLTLIVRQAVRPVPAGRRRARPGRSLPGAQRRVAAAADGGGRDRDRHRGSAPRRASRPPTCAECRDGIIMRSGGRDPGLPAAGVRAAAGEPARPPAVADRARGRRCPTPRPWPG